MTTYFCREVQNYMLIETLYSSLACCKHMFVCLLASHGSFESRYIHVYSSWFPQSHIYSEIDLPSCKLT